MYFEVSTSCLSPRAAPLSARTSAGLCPAWAPALLLCFLSPSEVSLELNHFTDCLLLKPAQSWSLSISLLYSVSPEMFGVYEWCLGGRGYRPWWRGSSQLLDTQLSLLLLVSRPLSHLPPAFAKVRLSVRKTVGLKEESAGPKASEGINSFSKFILTTSNVMVGLSDPREEAERCCFLFGPLLLYSALQSESASTHRAAVAG